MVSKLCDDDAERQKRLIERHIASQERLLADVDFRKMTALMAAIRAVDRLRVIGWCL